MRDDAEAWNALIPDLEQVEVRPDPEVVASVWTRERIPLGRAGTGDLVAIDLDPGEDGTIGQIVTCGHDSEFVRWVAPSWQAYLERLASDLEAGRYRVDPDGLSHCAGPPRFPRAGSPRQPATLPAFEERFPEAAARVAAELREREALVGTGSTRSLDEALAAPERAARIEDRYLGAPLPPEIGTLQWTRALVFQHVHGPLPAELGYLTRLEEFKAAHSGLRGLPDTFVHLGSETADGPDIDLWDNPLGGVPPVLLEMRLSRLCLWECNLTDLPAIPDAWRELVSLYLADNRIRELPEGFWTLRKLRRLTLSQNPGIVLDNPAAFAGLAALTTLDVGLASLTAFPQAAAAAPALETLKLNHNAITRLPSVEFPALIHLDLWENPIARVDDVVPLLAACPKLRSLRLESTPLGELPGELDRLCAMFPHLVLKV